MDINKRIIDTAPLSIMIIDKRGTITFVNKYYETVSKNKNPINKNIFEIPFFKKEGLDVKFSELFKNGTPFKKKHCASGDNTRFINITAVPLMGENGEVEGALSMATDDTDIYLTKQKLRELNVDLQGEVEERNIQLNETNEKLKKYLDLKSRFISDASHELRTPLAIAKLNLEFFANEFPCKEGKPCKSKEMLSETLKNVSGELEKVIDIVAELTFLASIDENSVGEIRMEKVNLNNILEHIVRRLEILANEKKIEIEFKSNSKNYELTGDTRRLERLFLNIIRNAIKYGKRSGKVEIWIEKSIDKKYIGINVKDNGIGIPEDDLPHIFDRFYRGDSSKENGEGGFGLGLSICKWIAEQHNGYIKVISLPGKGSTFTVFLPA